MGRGGGNRPGGSRRSLAPSRLRLLLAQAAARIMAEDQATTHRAALDKAIRSLGGDLHKQDRPEPAEIDEQLVAYLELFQPQQRKQWLHRQRRTALQAMEYFSAFKPRLAGAVLRGASTAESAVELHVFADADDEVALKLINLGIRYDLSERRFCWPDGREQACPVYAFEADGQAVEVVVFDHRELANPPLSRLTGHGVERADQRAVRRLLEAD